MRGGSASLIPHPSSLVPQNGQHLLEHCAGVADQTDLRWVEPADLHGVGVQVDQNIPVKTVRGDAIVAPVQMEHDDVDSHVRRAPLWLAVPDEASKTMAAITVTKVLPIPSLAARCTVSLWPGTTTQVISTCPLALITSRQRSLSFPQPKIEMQ